MVSHPTLGGALVLAALLASSPTGWPAVRRDGDSPASGPARTWSAPARRDRRAATSRITLIVTANYDAGRTGLVYRARCSAGPAASSASRRRAQRPGVARLVGHRAALADRGDRDPAASADRRGRRSASPSSSQPPPWSRAGRAARPGRSPRSARRPATTRPARRSPWRWSARSTRAPRRLRASARAPGSRRRGNDRPAATSAGAPRERTRRDSDRARDRRRRGAGARRGGPPTGSLVPLRYPARPARLAEAVAAPAGHGHGPAPRPRGHAGLPGSGRRASRR